MAAETAAGAGAPGAGRSAPSGPARACATVTIGTSHVGRGRRCAWPAATCAVVHLLATAGAGRAVHRWDAATGAPLGTVSHPGGAGVRSLAINVMRTQLAIADKNGTTYVWNLPS